MPSLNSAIATPEYRAELVDKGQTIYNLKLRPILEPVHNNEYVAIHVDTEDYALGRTFREASDALQARHPKDGRMVGWKIGPEPIPDGFIKTINELENTVMGVGEYDEDFKAPTRDVVKEARRILEDSITGSDYPRGSVASDGDGGIRVEWAIGQARVLLVLPSNLDSSHIYRRNNDKTSAIIDSPTGEILARELGELIHGQNATHR
jgi:hypothetical protein